MANEQSNRHNSSPANCEYCGGGIEFDASEFAEHESRATECPHCRKEAKIFVPK